VKIGASGRGTISDPLDASPVARRRLRELAAAVAEIDPRLVLEAR